MKQPETLNASGCAMKPFSQHNKLNQLIAYFLTSFPHTCYLVIGKLILSLKTFGTTAFALSVCYCSAIVFFAGVQAGNCEDDNDNPFHNTWFWNKGK